jgi:hypothetical protein
LRRHFYNILNHSKRRRIVKDVPKCFIIGRQLVMGQFTLKNDLIFHNVILGCSSRWILKSRRPEQGSQKFVLWIYFLCFLDFKRTGIYLCTGKTLRPFWIGASNLAFSHTILSIWKQINLGRRGAGAEFEGAQLQGRRFSDADLSLGYCNSLTFNVWHYIYECHVDMASIWCWHGCDMPCGIFMWHWCEIWHGIYVAPWKV